MRLEVTTKDDQRRQKGGAFVVFGRNGYDKSQLAKHLKRK
jgi:hypothetical protein